MGYLKIEVKDAVLKGVKRAQVVRINSYIELCVICIAAKINNVLMDDDP